MAKKKNGELPDPLVTGLIGFAIVMIILRLKNDSKKVPVKPKTSLGGRTRAAAVRDKKRRERQREQWPGGKSESEESIRLDVPGAGTWVCTQVVERPKPRYYQRYAR
jgi:hypothetical protein